MKYSRCFANPRTSHEEPIPLIATNYEEPLIQGQRKPLNIKTPTPDYFIPTQRCKTAQNPGKREQRKSEFMQPHTLEDMYQQQQQYMYNLLRQNALSKCYIQKDADNKLYLVPNVEQNDKFELNIQKVKLQTCVRKRNKPKKVMLARPKKSDMTPTILNPSPKSINPHIRNPLTSLVSKDSDRRSTSRDSRERNSLNKRSLSTENTSVQNRSFSMNKNNTNARSNSPNVDLKKASTINRPATSGNNLTNTKRCKTNSKNSMEIIKDPHENDLDVIKEARKAPLIKRHKAQISTIPRAKHYYKPPPKVIEEPEPPERLKRVSKPIFIAQEYYGFSITEGNNSQLVRKIMEKRCHSWKEVPNFSSVFHYKWQPISRGIRFELLNKAQKQMVNHFEGHEEITTKDMLFKNLLAYCELNKMNAFDFVPLTFTLDLDSPTYASDFEKFSYCYATIDAINNGLEKEALNRDEILLKAINSKLHKISFSRDRRVVSHSRAKITKTHYAGKNLWILKPTGFNRGRGVSVFDTMQKLKSLIRLYSNDYLAPITQNESKFEFSTIGNPKKKQSLMDQVEIDQEILKATQVDVCKVRTYVIQKYIERPLLIYQRKFDIRVWVLVTHEMKVYFFKEGYLRTSSEIYTLESDSVKNKNVHLTNNAVQKYSEKYGQFEDGNQLSFDAFQVFF